MSAANPTSTPATAEPAPGATTAPSVASATSKDAPWPVRTLSRKMVDYIARAPQVWVEGQIAQISARSRTSMVFLTLRDTSADVSLQVSAFRSAFTELGRLPKEGERVIVHGSFDFYAVRGSLSFRIDQVHPVGIGELLARLERLRKLLAAEGLTSPERKKPLPFMPQMVGLITGRASAAEQDVLTNAQRRWPAVAFRVINTPVQGATAVPKIVDALAQLDADPDVDVIVLARGGGSMEDLLPFSDETLCREVVACRTPVVSAIGHEPDHPIVDDVADQRCSTPTDAGKTIVPDAAQEQRQLDVSRHRMRRALVGWVNTESARLARLTSAPSLADPYVPLDGRREQVASLTDRSAAALFACIERGDTIVQRHRAQLAVLGPAATLARGYSVVQVAPATGNPATGAVLRHIDDAPDGTELRIRVADGALTATSHGSTHQEGH